MGEDWASRHNQSYAESNSLVINQVGDHKKGFIPEFQGHRGMGKQGQSNFDDMAMFAFYTTILLMSIRARNMMRDPNALEKGIEFLVFTPN